MVETQIILKLHMCSILKVNFFRIVEHPPSFSFFVFLFKFSFKIVVTLFVVDSSAGFHYTRQETVNKVHRLLSCPQDFLSCYFYALLACFTENSHSPPFLLPSFGLHWFMIPIRNILPL